MRSRPRRRNKVNNKDECNLPARDWPEISGAQSGHSAQAGWELDHL